MSHVAKYETTIGKNGCVNEALLKKAIEFAAKELEGEVSGTFDSRHQGKNLPSFEGKPLLASIRTKDMKEGMGVILTKDKKIQFVHDLDGNRSAFQKAQASVERNYKTLALAVALQKINYKTEVVSANGLTVITGTDTTLV